MQMLYTPYMYVHSYAYRSVEEYESKINGKIETLLSGDVCLMISKKKVNYMHCKF